MPSNKSLVKASNGFPAQNYNPTAGQYEESYGSDNAIHTKVQNFPATQNVQLTGSNLEYYGATVTERPDPTTVPVGAVYMAVQTQETWQSDGTSWVVV